MKTMTFLFALALTMSGMSTLHAQGFTPPSEGKAAVYFVRVTSFGAAVSFEFFDNNRYIGAFKGKNYMRFELDPGEHLLWVSTENKEFLTADLKAGGIYVIVTDVIMGAWKARVGLDILTTDAKDKELLQRVKDLVNKKAPKVTPEKVIEKRNKELEPFIAEKLELYEKEWKNTKNFKHLAADMAIPIEALK